MSTSSAEAVLGRRVAQQCLLNALSAGKTFQIPSEMGPLAHPHFAGAILSRDPRCFLDGGTLHIPTHPYLTSVYNRNVPWAALTLRLVCGSLGFGTGESPWYAFGNPEYTTHDEFMAGHPIAWNWHVWLEAEDGGIWDVCDALWHDLAADHGQRILHGSAATTTVIRGEPPDRLKALGLRYVPAPPATQRALLDAAECLYSPQYNFIK
jgi:hypothetical protein